MSEKGGLDVGRGSSGLTLKRIVLILGLVFAVALAVMVGTRMSAEAMAVVIGVVCGVAAAIPTSILLLVVLTRQERLRSEEAQRMARPEGYPPVVVVQGGMSHALPPGPHAGYWPAQGAMPPMQREFHVVGGEDTLVDDRRY